MADNDTLPATGSVMATDDIGGVKFPRVKLVHGADGTNDGDVSSANPLPVEVVTGGDGSVQGVDAHDAAITADPVLCGGYASAAAPTNVSADGDAVRAWFLRNGAQCVNVTAAGTLVAAGGGTEATALRVTIATDSTGVVSVDDNGGSITVDGAVTATGAAAHDAAVSGNPVLVGLEARTTDGTAVSAAGDVVRATADTLGKQVVLLGAVHDRHVRGTTNYTTNSAADVIAAAGAGVRIAVMSILVTNAHATVATKVTIRTATTSRIVGYAAAAGGGFAINGGGVPLFITAANEAVTAICGTTGSDIDVTVSGYTIAN